MIVPFSPRVVRYGAIWALSNNAVRGVLFRVGPVPVVPCVVASKSVFLYVVGYSAPWWTSAQDSNAHSGSLGIRKHTLADCRTRSSMEELGKCDAHPVNVVCTEVRRNRAAFRSPVPSAVWVVSKPNS
jgi:hypothetical protein